MNRADEARARLKAWLAEGLPCPCGEVFVGPTVDAVRDAYLAHMEEEHPGPDFLAVAKRLLDKIEVLEEIDTIVEALKQDRLGFKDLRDMQERLEDLERGLEDKEGA